MVVKLQPHESMVRVVNDDRSGLAVGRIMGELPVKHFEGAGAMKAADYPVHHLAAVFSTS